MQHYIARELVATWMRSRKTQNLTQVEALAHKLQLVRPLLASSPMGDNGTPPPMATPRVAAGALIRDVEGRILLVKPTYKDGWDIPGGYVEPGESPADACNREIAEEIGLHRKAG